MLEILIIHHSGYIGGAGVSLMEIIKSIDKSKYSVTVLLPDNPGLMADELKRMSVKIIKTSYPIPIFAHFNGSTNFLFSYHSIRNIFSIFYYKHYIINDVKRVNPDIIFVNSMTLFYIANALNRKNYKTICFHRESYTSRYFGFRNWVIKRSLRNHFTKVVFLSEYDRSQTKISKEKSEIIHDTVDESLYNDCLSVKNDSKDININKCSILYTGGMVKLKGAHIIIKALSKLPDEYRLIFMQYKPITKTKTFRGCKSFKEKVKYFLGMDYESKVLKLIEKNNLWDRIDFYDATHDIAYYFKKSQVVVFPSTIAHQARPLYEAGISEKPFIITDSPNIKEFTRFRNVLTFKNNDVIDLVNKITVLRDHGIKNDLIKNNKDMVIKYHSSIYLKNKVEFLLDSIT